MRISYNFLKINYLRMKKNSLFICAVCLVVTLTTACSSLQKTPKTTRIGGANKVAATASASSGGSSVANSGTSSSAARPVYAEEVAPQEEVTRSEKFSLAEGEKPTALLGKNYHVVVGSFKSRDNAKGLQNTLNLEGNTSVVVITESGMYRVLLASFDTYSEARACINKVANRFFDAWVLVNK
jgi:cell division protein FtsN